VQARNFRNARGERDDLLSPRVQWIAACVNSKALARDWEDNCCVVIAEDRRARVHVFAWLNT
jgi:hypothetical protein